MNNTSIANSSQKKPFVWQQEQWETLQNLWQQQRLPHALMACGPRGIGKQHLCEAFAYALLCEDLQNGFSCGQCRSCQLLAAGTHPDLLMVIPSEGSQLIKIEQIRQLADFVTKTTQQGGYRIILISPAEAMNNNAANALLKSLEEPTPHTLLLLISHQPGRLLPTIKSRCQTVIIKTPSREKLDGWLDDKVPQLQLDHLFRLAENRPLLALQMAEGEQLSLRVAFAKELQAYLKQEISLSALMAKWAKEDVSLLLHWLSQWVQDVIMWMTSSEETRLIDREQLLFYQWCQQRGDYRGLFGLNDEIDRAIRQLQSSANPNKQLLLENMLIQWFIWSRGR